MQHMRQAEGGCRPLMFAGLSNEREVTSNVTNYFYRSVVTNVM